MSQSNQGSEIKRLRAENAELKDIIAEYQKQKRDDTSRNDMADDGKINIQNISPAMAEQIMTSFEQDYDAQTKQNLNDLKQRSGTDHPDVVKYLKRKEEYDALKRKFP